MRKKRKGSDHAHREIGGAVGISIDMCIECGEMLVGLFNEDGNMIARTIIKHEHVGLVISELTLKYHAFAKRGAKVVEIGDPLILN